MGLGIWTVLGTGRSPSWIRDGTWTCFAVARYWVGEGVADRSHMRVTARYDLLSYLQLLRMRRPRWRDYLMTIVSRDTNAFAFMANVEVLMSFLVKFA